MDPDAYLTVKEIAAELGLSDSAVYRIIRSGALPATRRSAHGTRVRRRVLDAYVMRIQPRSDRPSVPAESNESESVHDQHARLYRAFVEAHGMTPEAWNEAWDRREIDSSSAEFGTYIEALGLEAAANAIGHPGGATA